LPTNDSLDIAFYTALKNASPLAALCSLAIIVASFTFPNVEQPELHQNALLASIMFLISFILSMFDQLLPKKKDIFMLGYGKYFFLVVGVFYFAVLSWEFSNHITEVWKIILSWVIILIGVSLLTHVIKRKGKFDSNLYDKPRQYQLVLFVGHLSGSCFLLAGLVYLSDAFTGSIIPGYDLLLVVGGAIIAAVVLAICEVIIISKSIKRTL
jgi:hypothetical protein